MSEVFTLAVLKEKISLASMVLSVLWMFDGVGSVGSSVLGMGSMCKKPPLLESPNAAKSGVGIKNAIKHAAMKAGRFIGQAGDVGHAEYRKRRAGGRRAKHFGWW